MDRNLQTGVPFAFRVNWPGRNFRMNDVPRLLTAEEMAELDRYTIEVLGVPGHILMENAGFAWDRKSVV